MSLPRASLLACLLVSAAALAGGCKTWWGDDGPEFSYPQGNKAFWEAARNGALDGIGKIDGKRPKLTTDQRCESVKGARKYSGMWCWPYQPYGWVAGLCHLENPIRPQVGCHPTTGGELHAGVAQHEQGHAVLWNVRKDATHNPKYRSVLWGWSGPDPATGLRSALVEIGGVRMVLDGFPFDAEHPAPEDSTP